MDNAAYREADPAAKNLTTAIYGLYAASFFVGITAIVAIILNYLKREAVAGTILESHFRWQMRTFWYGMLWGVIGGILCLVLIGIPILIADSIWIIYRIVKGWLNLSENKPMYTN